MRADLNKPEFETYTTEVGVIKEIDYAIKHIKSWTKPKKAAISVEQLPGFARIYPEPLGVVLIVGPWNYPFQLMISPLVGAIAAGNCAMLKPSELASHTSSVLAEIIQKHFDPAYIAVVEGESKSVSSYWQKNLTISFLRVALRLAKLSWRQRQNISHPLRLS